MTEERAASTQTAPSIPEFDAALESGDVTFETLTQAFHAEFLAGDPATGQAIYSYYYPRLLDAHKKSSYATRKRWYGPLPGSGVGVTPNGDLTIMVSARQVDSQGLPLAWECEHLAGEAKRVLDGQDLQRCADKAYDVATYILGYLDHMKELSDDEREVRLEQLQEQVSALRQLFEESAQRRAQLRYLRGVASGVGIVVIATALAVGAIEMFEVGIVDPQQVSVVVLAGGVGAWVSVMYRFSFKKMVLDALAGDNQIRNIGRARPLIGAIFSLVIYALLRSGIMRVELPTGASAEIFFFGVIAFLAGFSERWAQDVLVLAERRASH